MKIKSKFIYQMCTFQKFTSIENLFTIMYKFDSFYTSREKAIKGVKSHIKFIEKEYNAKISEWCFLDDKRYLYSIIALVENGEKKEYYGFKKHKVNI